jgi:hypothetical protein
VHSIRVHVQQAFARLRFQVSRLTYALAVLPHGVVGPESHSLRMHPMRAARCVDSLPAGKQWANASCVCAEHCSTLYALKWRIHGCADAVTCIRVLVVQDVRGACLVGLELFRDFPAGVTM